MFFIVLAYGLFCKKDILIASVVMLVIFYLPLNFILKSIVKINPQSEGAINYTY